MDRIRGAGALVLTVQIVGPLLGLAALTLAPPRTGAMLLVPLAAGAGDHLAGRALEAGARLLAPGWLPGSLIVYGARGRLAPRMLRAGILVVGAQVPCGGDAAGGAVA